MGEYSFKQVRYSPLKVTKAFPTDVEGLIDFITLRSLRITTCIIGM